MEYLSEQSICFLCLLGSRQVYAFCYDLKEMTGYNMEKGYEDDINHSGIVDIRPLNTDTERYYYFYTQERHSEEENQVLCIGTLKK